MVVAPKTQPPAEPSSQAAQQRQAASTQPAFDVYYAENKFTKERVVVKVIKDFKSRPSEFQQCVMLQINNQIQLQQLPKASALIQKISYTIVNNNLYVSSLQCTDSLRQCIDRI